MSWRLVRWAVACVMVAFVGAAGAVDQWGAFAAPAAHADAVVVMGCPPNQDGSPSDCLIRRVDRGVALWREGRAPVIVLTGGELRGLEAEARVAARLALDQGVPGPAIVLEPMSTNTWENARNTVSLARLGAVIVVSDQAHLLRATRCFAAFGVGATGSGVPEPLWARLSSAARELVALLDYGLRGRLAAPNRPPSAPPT